MVALGDAGAGSGQDDEVVEDKAAAGDLSCAGAAAVGRGSRSRRVHRGDANDAVAWEAGSRAANACDGVSLRGCGEEKSCGGV